MKLVYLIPGLRMDGFWRDIHVENPAPPQKKNKQTKKQKKKKKTQNKKIKTTTTKN